MWSPDVLPCASIIHFQKISHIHNFLCKAYWPHFEEHQFVRQESFFPAPSVMEYFGVEIDFRPSCLDPPFRSLFAVPTNIFCSELYRLYFLYRRVRPWILYLAMNISPPNVYWTVHHCKSWGMKNQLDVPRYFILLIMRSTCFGH